MYINKRYYLATAVLVLLVAVASVRLSHGATIKREIITKNDATSSAERANGRPGTEAVTMTPQQRRMLAKRDRETRKGVSGARPVHGNDTDTAVSDSKEAEQPQEHVQATTTVRADEEEAEEEYMISTMPSFDIDMYTASSWYQGGDEESEAEPLRDQTTVDYDQRFDRIELSTPPTLGDDDETRFEESQRFDSEPEEQSSATTQATAPATTQKEDPIEENRTHERNSSTYYNNAEVQRNEYSVATEEVKGHEIVEETTNEIADTTPNGGGVAGTGQKRGKFLQNPEHSTVINSGSGASSPNDLHLSIPNTAEVWALAGMKNVEHGKTKAGFHYNLTSERDWGQAHNSSTATKLLTDWMEIMKNDELVNSSAVLRNDIPHLGEERPEDRPTPSILEDVDEQRAGENKLVPVVALAPVTTTDKAARFEDAFQSTTTSGDYSTPTTTENNFEVPQISAVSDNLYYEDFSTNAPDFVTTEESLLPATDAPWKPILPTTVLDNIFTLPGDYRDQHKTQEGAVTTSNIILTTEAAAAIREIATTEAFKPEAELTSTMPNPHVGVVKQPAPITTTPSPSDAESPVLESSTSNPDINNISIERITETKLVESNNLPEYSTVEKQPHRQHDLGDGNNNNYSNNYNVSQNNEQHNSIGGGGGNRAAVIGTDNADDVNENYEFATPTTTTTIAPTSTTTAKVSVEAEAEREGEAVAIEANTNNGHHHIVEQTTTTTVADLVDFGQPDQPVEQMVTTTPRNILDVVAVTTTTTTERILIGPKQTNGHQDSGPLMANHTLEVSQIGVASEGSAINTDEGVEPEPRDVNAIIAITVSVIAVIALILLVGFLYVMKKRQKQLTYGQRCRPVGLDSYSLDNVSVFNSVRRKNNLRLSKRSYGNSAFEDPELKGNNLSILALGKMATDKIAIYEEFKEIPLVTARVEEVPPGCEDKNRYANVVPLPETRVNLKQLNNDEKTEYINANFVRGPKDNTNYYIACQAPMDNTIVDFWRMIWEQNSKVIVMLTDLTENGIEKCAEYLPPSAVLDCNRVFGDYSVTLKNREVKDKYAVSTVHLKNSVTNTWREIMHFWYQWPEEGMPTDETSVIAMMLEARSYLKMPIPEQIDMEEGDADDEKRQKIRDLNDDLTEKLEIEVEGAEKKENLTVNGSLDKSKSLQRSQGPLTVHCSPGTGRTGTIIACDIAIRSLEQKARSVDPPQIVYYVRRGRASSIKTREQYEFIYRCANTYATKLTGPITEN